MEKKYFIKIYTKGAKPGYDEFLSEQEYEFYEDASHAFKGACQNPRTSLVLIGTIEDGHRYYRRSHRKQL